MCGITGLFSFGGIPASLDTLRAMNNRLTHRGPDGEGYFIDGPVGLAHRRLAIIDLASGQQPMATDDGTVVVTFNGEIYNFIELKRELEARGCTFRTSSDTEVVLYAYQIWGLQCFEHFNGMWALALWDARKRVLILSRDRLGEKPLYYATHDRTLVFASEIKSLLAYGVPSKPRLELLEIYLTLGYIPAPHSFYEGIQKVKPGHYLQISGENVVERPYWKLPQVDESSLHKDAQQVAEQFEYLFDDSVRIRMRADVPFGAFLSGGLDSGSVVAAMTRHTVHPVQTFTIGFQERHFDERERARRAATALKTQHREYVVEAEAYEDAMQRVLRHYDEPFGDSSAIPTGYLCRYARQHVKMALTGDGGDEALSGYSTYQGEVFSAHYQALPRSVQTAVPGLLNRLAFPLRGGPRYLLNRAYRVSTAAIATFEERLRSKLAFTDLHTIHQLTRHIPHVVRFEDYLADAMRDCAYRDPFYRLMYFHLMVSLPDDMLAKVDRMSMAFSLETRMPFLDHRLVELMSTTSKSVKMPRYRRKAVLRDTVASGLPRSIRWGSKRGFVVPLREWFRRDSLRDQRVQLLELQSTAGIPRTILQSVVDDAATGRTDNGNFVWMLSVLSRWLQSAV